MVQGEKYERQSVDTSAFGQLDASAKRSKFLALQKSFVANNPAKAANSNQKMASSTKSNWGPFKDRNDFVNMHFS